MFFLYGFLAVLGAVQDVCNKYGSCVRLWLGKQLFMILTDPTDIEVCTRTYIY